MRCDVLRALFRDLKTVALDLYFKGTSLRKIVDHLEQFYERKLDHTTVLYWVKKYTSIISEYAETLSPKLGGIWHADEMKVKTKRDEWSWGCGMLWTARRVLW
jgi:transposase-like protein